LGVLTASRDPDQALDVQLRDHAFRGNMTERLVRVYRDVINRRKTITGLIPTAMKEVCTATAVNGPAVLNS
jgi:hypothetical protein